MDELDRLLLAARLEPEDDVPRQVLADCLDEAGTPAEQALAQFIRIQCRLSRLPTHHAERADLEWEQRGLWWNHVETWLGPIYEASREFTFRRGLARVELYGNCVPAEEFAAFLSDPGWRWVDELHWIAPDATAVAQLLASSAFSWLNCLHLERGPCLSPELVIEPNVDRLPLRELRLSQCQIYRFSLLSLGRWPDLPQLRLLDLAHNHLRGCDLDALAHLENMPRLSAVNLRNNLLYERWEDGLGTLLASPLPYRLRRLWLGHNRLGNRVGALLCDPALAGLVELDLSGNQLEDQDMELLAGLAHLGQLRRLDLSSNFILSAGIAALTSSPCLDSLEELDLRDNYLDADSLWALIRAPRLYGLRRLRLSRLAYNAYPLLGRLYGRFGRIVEVE